MKVVIGGTFDRIHDGHKSLFKKAAEIGKVIVIGLTSDDMADLHRCDRDVQKFNDRKRNLENYLKKNFLGLKYEIEKIDAKYNQRLIQDLDADAIVASEGKHAEIQKINKLRKSHKLKPLKPILVPYVLAEDGTPIKATKIINGEMDKHGKMLRAIIVHVGSTNKVKLQATEKVFSKIFSNVKVRVKGFEVDSGVESQPFGDRTLTGARNRAKAVMTDSQGLTRGVRQPDFGVGIEAGLIWNSKVRNYFDVQYCAIIDKAGRITIGHGSGFQYPQSVIQEVKQGKSIGVVMEELTGIENIGKKRGAIGYLSKDILDRTELTEQAVLMAMIPRLRDF